MWEGDANCVGASLVKQSVMVCWRRGARQSARKTDHAGRIVYRLESPTTALVILPAISRQIVSMGVPFEAEMCGC